MNLKKIIREEIDDLKWIKDTTPIPPEILNIDSYPPGKYKIWLGDISKEYQLLILDYLINLIKDNDNLETDRALLGIRTGVISDKSYINSLYFDIGIPNGSTTKYILITMMANYLNSTKYGSEYWLRHNMDYFNQGTATDLTSINFSFKQLKERKINESNDMKWIIDQDPNNVHITDLKLGQVVMVNCPKLPSFKNRKFTVDEIANSARKGDICVHFKEMDKIQYPFGTDREPNIPGMTMCEHLGCNFKLIKDINESLKPLPPQDMLITSGALHVIYFPSEKSVLDREAWYGVDNDDDGVELVPFDPKYSHNITDNGFTGDAEELLREVRNWINEVAIDFYDADDSEYYQNLANEMVIRTFIVKIEEVTRIDSSFFDKF